jgi:PmbA protein
MKEEVLELASKAADQAEVYAITSETTPVSFEANRLKSLQTRETRGLALRLIKDGRLGFASATRLDNLRALVESALEVAPFGAEARFEFPAEDAARQVQIYDPALADLTVERMVEMGQEMIDRVRGYNSAILCNADLRQHVSTVSLLNSRGGHVTYQKTALSIGFHANLIRGTDMLDIYESAASCHHDLDPQELAEVVLEKIRLAERIAPIATRPLPVIFTPKGVAYTLILPLEVALNGKMVLEGASPLGDKLGQRAFDQRLSLYDDGQVDGAPASAPYDDEGVPTRRTPLIEEGVVWSFYYDLQTAGLAGARSTGNAARSLSSLPSPSTTSLIFAEGAVSYPEMLADMEEGLIVDQTMGAWAGNVLAGEFSGNVHLGYRVEKGRIVGRVKDTMVTGNVFEALADVAAIGDETVWVGGELKAPYLYFRSLGVASKG